MPHDPSTDKAIIFDKDGTLFGFTQTWGPWCVTLIEGLARDAAHAHALAQVVGFDLETQIYAANSPVIAGTPDQSADLMLPLLPDWTRDALIAHMIAQPVTGIVAADLPALCATLRQRGYSLSVMTNDSEQAAVAQMTALGIATEFACIIGYDSGYGQKPDPEPLLACARIMGVVPARCLMVGDSLHDLNAGAAAGMTTIGVLTGVASAKTLDCADAVLPSIADLPRWLDQRATES